MFGFKTKSIMTRLNACLYYLKAQVPITNAAVTRAIGL